MHVRYALTLVSSLGIAGVAHAGVIPEPRSIETQHGSFHIDSSTTLSAPGNDRDAQFAADYLRELWRRSNGLEISYAPPQRAAMITFTRRPGTPPQGYRIEVRARSIRVTASTSAGLFYGAVTLWQLLAPERGAHRIEAQTITDEPQYVWRGLLLDSARHFQSTAFIRSMLDWMAWHKLNVLHWHLTDDQGWRLEIKKYPRLTSVGAWRIPAHPPWMPDGAPYGGFYTQAEVRELVAYAAARHINIVPEIDMPGHAQAAIAAYPETGTTARPLKVSSRWGVHTHLFNVEPATFDFLEDVLTEVMQMFPSREIHVGGDEAVTDEWQASAQVQARMRELGINDAAALQFYFTQEIGRFLTRHGRRLVGWDEILCAGLPQDALIMSWRGVAGAHAAALAGHDAVLTAQPTLYLDHRQSTLPMEPTGRLQASTLQEVYDFPLRDPGLDERQQAHVIGVQANLWTEHMPTEQLVEWMALPRAAALAELGWSASRDFPDFLRRLLPQFKRYRAFGLNYADSAYGVDATVTGISNSMRLSLTAQRGEIRYSIGNEPLNLASAQYSQPLAVQPGESVNFASFVGAEQASRTTIQQIDDHAGIRRNSRQLTQCSTAVGLILQGLALDIMNPCWVEQNIDLSHGAEITAAVAALPFNFELGADAATIRLSAAPLSQNELQVYIDHCDAQPAAMVVFTDPLSRLTELQVKTHLPPLAGRHDLCFRIARPRLNPLWALDWIEVSG